MHSYRVEKILKEIPEARTIRIPSSWFDRLNNNESVFTALYKWMVNEQKAPAEDFGRLHNLTFVGQKVNRALRAAEKRRIAKNIRLSGEKLKNAVNWSDGNCGPQALFAGKHISGDVLVVFPSSVEERLSLIQDLFAEEDRLKENARIVRLASGNDFAQWLFSNSDRDDPVGDLAQDALRDVNFPKIVHHYKDIRRHLNRYSSAVIEALNDAWFEYVTKYPDRIERIAWCDSCDEEISNFDTGVIIWSDTEGFQIIHENCFSEDDHTLINLFQGDGFVAFDFSKASKASHEDIDRIKSLLVCWGWMKKVTTSVVYFIQSEALERPIKIGYTTGSVNRRLDQLQTGHHAKLILLASVAGGVALEKELHNKFRPWHLVGEWFSPDHNIVEYIERIKNGERI